MSRRSRRAPHALLLLLLAPASASAQHVLGVSIGVRSDTVREDLVVPLGFSGPGLDLGVDYRGAVGRGLLSAGLHLGAAPMFNRFGHEALAIRYGADVSYVHPVASSPQLRVLVGGIAALDTSVNFLESWDDAHGYWLGTQWLGPAARIVGPLSERWRYELSPSFSLAGFQSRPPLRRLNKQDAMTEASWYVDDVHADESFASFLDFQVFRLDLTLRRAQVGEPDAIGGEWAFGVDARARHSTDTASLVELSANFHASIGWTL